MPRASSALRQIAPYLNLGGVLAGCVVLGALFGRWLDSKLGTEPGFLLGGSLFGIGSGFYHFFKVVLRKQKKSEDQGSQDGPGEGVDR